MDISGLLHEFVKIDTLTPCMYQPQIHCHRFKDYTEEELEARPSPRLVARSLLYASLTKKVVNSFMKHHCQAPWQRPLPCLLHHSTFPYVAE